MHLPPLEEFLLALQTVAFYALDRAVVFSLHCPANYVSLLYYPIPLNRNVIVYSVGFTEGD
jgi:hypothetical protein